MFGAGPHLGQNLPENRAIAQDTRVEKQGKENKRKDTNDAGQCSAGWLNEATFSSVPEPISSCFQAQSVLAGVQSHMLISTSMIFSTLPLQITPRRQSWRLAEKPVGWKEARHVNWSGDGVDSKERSQKLRKNLPRG